MTNEEVMNIFKEKGIEVTIYEAPYHTIENVIIDTYEHDKQIRAEVIDEILSKIHTTWLFRGNSAKPYREEIDYIIRTTFKEQK